MMKFSKKTQGVISVFLILILLPTMVFSAILVDGSRMVSARAMSQEAADLAALSVLSNYNSTLKEEFGLFSLKDSASAETVFQESLKATLQASGLGEQSYSEQVWDIMKGALGANPYLGEEFINLYDFQLDQSSVTPLYTLANPEVLQNQIVEYSKYRGLYVLSERLGLLNQISDISKQVEEQKKATNAMEEKMDVDEKNGNADKNVVVVQNDIKAFNAKLAGMGGQRYNFTTHLTAEMEVLAEVEDLSDETKKMAEDYNKVKGETQTYYTEIDPLAAALHDHIPPAKSEVEKAIQRLNGFIGKYSGSDNETVKELVEDARNHVKAYQKTLDDLNTVNSDTTLNTVYNNKTGSAIAGVIGGIDTAVHRYSSEKDDDEEEESNYEFYYYDSDNSTEDAGEARGDYSDTWMKVLEIAEESQVPQVVSSNGKYPEETSEDTNMKEKAKEKSGSQQEVENMKADPSPQSIEASVYQSLPSKTFDAQAEAASYSAILSEDSQRAIAAGEAIRVGADQGGGTNTDFYNEEGDLSGSKSILQANENSFMTQLGGVAEAARDEVLTLSYIFGTFKTRLTGNDKFKKGALDESKKDKFYIVDWRYLHDGGEQDLQFSPKSERKTRLNAEIEYLIYGNSSDTINEAAVYASIYAPRMANNMIALYSNKTVKGSCDAAALAASAATLGSIPQPVFFWIFLTAWTVAETILDMHYLIDEGYRIPLFKTKDTILLETDFAAGPSADMVEHYRKSNGSDKNIYVCYEDYLLMLLLLEGSQKRLMRTADLVEMNMQLTESGFKMDKAYTYIRAKSNLSICYLFLDTKPFTGEYEGAGLSGRLKFESVIYQGY